MGKANKIDKVKVGYKTYKIERPPAIKEVGGELCGSCDFHDCIIKIADKLDQDDKNLVFLHELIHSICSRLSIDRLNADEQTLDRLATGLYEVIKDNPHIFTMADI